MNNNERLEFIIRFERKRKLKRIALIAGLLLLLGALMVYFQVMNFQDV